MFFSKTESRKIGLKKIVTGLVVFLELFALCSANSTRPGAARQMYGSGSLRPAGSKPILAIGQRQYGTRTTKSPMPTNKKFPVLLPVPPYSVFPLPIPKEELPFLFPIPRLDQNRGGGGGGAGGMYGGRPEYYQGKPRTFDFGQLPGKGFAVATPKMSEDELLLERFNTHLDLDHNYEISHDIDEDHFDPNKCKDQCPPEKFLCKRSCQCIDKQKRCDSHKDCDDNEDEQNCPQKKPKCDETKNFVMCPKTKRCISRDWLCDGDDDCGDFSDETRCGLSRNCTTDQFQCENGLCIPRSWACDNDNDCRDFSDELNCTRKGCTTEEFECADSMCIPDTWKCDRHLDCSDGSDEHDCDIIPPHCNEKEFQCSNHNCIKIEFKCDGDDDCEDWSDEDDCPKMIGDCVTGEFKCKSGKCIPRRFLCDKQKDCEEEEDETECMNYSQNRTCSADEYTCPGGDCILKTWVCDGLNDCTDGEDEAKCEIVCDESKFPCSGPAPNDTATMFCIGVKHRCDGQKDCPKGEDELHCPKTRDCEKNTKCSQLCITKADGSDGCSCLNGYRLNKDGKTCDDINECLYATDPVCSQTCNNTIGSFRCGCMTGYVLRPDLRTCKAVGAPPTLLFANRVDIRQMSLSNSKYKAVLKGLHNAISLDYHYEKRLIFWSDVSMDRIKRAFINGTNAETIVKSGLESPGGIALDWVHNLLFWTDSGAKRVEVSTLDGTQRAVIAASDLDKPRAIVVHPGEAYVIWSDWGPKPKIERAEMDGSNRKSIITESVFWPNGLALDFTTNQLYWADAKHNMIETAMLDGTKRRKVITKGLPHPFAITIFEDAIFWTDWHTKSISTANKITGAGFKTLHSHLHFPMDIHSYHPQRQPKYRNRCGKDNGGCAHLCLPNRKSFSCVCRMGQKLKPDGKSCQKPEKFLLFARKKDLRIKHLDTSNDNQPYEMVIPMQGIKQAVSVAWDSKTNYIYWSDVATATINRAFWNGSYHEVVVEANLVSPTGVAFDWTTDKIYFTDEHTNLIEVANSDGSMRSLLVWEGTERLGDITVDPQMGLMFWAEWGDKKSIERASMDGTGRSIIIQKDVMYPSGLTVDHGKIFWTDGPLKSISCANIDGTGRKIVLQGEDLPYPFGLDIFGNTMYWTDRKARTIEKANKLTGTNRTIVLKNVNDPMGLKVFHRTRKGVRSACSNNNGGCTHLCLLKPKGHSCACPTGIKLADDRKSCTNGPINFLILAHRVDIRQISLDVPYMADVVLPFERLKLATSVDVDRATGEIYWTDTAEDAIQKAKPDGKERKTIVTHEVEAPDGIAIDSTGRKVYWTDGERNSIEVAELDGSNRKLLFHRNLDNPRAITLHYHHGLMFWSDWGKQPKIECAHMDGNNRTTLIGTKLFWPNGLAIDRPAGRLYWNDAKMNVIESSDLNGRDRKTIKQNVPHPYGLVVVGNHIYWTDWKTESLHRADKETGSDSTVIKSNLIGLMDVRSVQTDNIGENACGKDNGGCSHLCLRNPKSYTCACPTGLAKNPNNDKLCEKIPETFLLMASRYSLSQISLDTLDAWDVTLPIKDDMRNVINVDFHWDKKLIFYTDIERNVIQSVSMVNMSDVRTVVSKDIQAPDGIAVDWIANNLYWTNTGFKKIEVSRLDGSSRKTVIKENVHDPRSIVVHPRRGYLYWSDWFVPKIERAHLDGSGRKVLVDVDLHFPIGLVLDFVGRRLYWIDARLNQEKIETTDFHGRNRIALSVQATHPFSLTQFDEFIYWTDWDQKTILRAEKTTGRDMIFVRPQLHAAMGITMVTKKRQVSWNPCAVDNGGCTHLCFFRQGGYSCACPDEYASNCKKSPMFQVSLKCPDKLFDCSNEDEDYDDEIIRLNDAEYEREHIHDLESNLHPHSTFFYMITLVIMLLVVILSVAVSSYMIGRRGGNQNLKTYSYGASRSFSNPNYYSASNEVNNPQASTGKNIWKRLKYDKSQERVYEETVGSGSPEVTSLIPTILTPCSSNCETVTPELERSPSITPLHKKEQITEPL